MPTKQFLKNKFKLALEPVIKITGRGKRFLPEKRFWELIYNNFPPGENFTFIQVGANDGKSFDILYDIVKERKSKGVVIEPLKDFYGELCKTYADFPEIMKINKAVHPTEKEVGIFRVDPLKESSVPEWARGIASLNPKHHKRSQTSSDVIIEERVSAAHLMDIINGSSLSCGINLLQIDVEGFDHEILKMVDFNTMKPDVIKYEFCNLSDTDNKDSMKLLRKQGYYLFNIDTDRIGVNLNKIKL